VIVADPTVKAVTRPVEETLATDGFDDTQTQVWFVIVDGTVTVSCCVLPTISVTDDKSSVITPAVPFVTVTRHEAE
jgi:hypothetical protein